LRQNGPTRGPQQLEKTPHSVATGIGIVLGLMTSVTVAAYFIEGYFRHHWWTPHYIATFAIPFTIAVVVQYIWFVPRRLCWDHETLEVDTWLGGNFRCPWSQLRHWGSPDMTFTLECGNMFGDGRSFQLALNYFTPESVKALRDFLNDNFPDRQASFWIGRHGIG
jgi:hypothetical protein